MSVTFGNRYKLDYSQYAGKNLNRKQKEDLARAYPVSFLSSSQASPRYQYCL